jgi:hypothetical protein
VIVISAGSVTNVVMVVMALKAKPMVSQRPVRRRSSPSG